MAVWYFQKKLITKELPSDPNDPNSPKAMLPVKAALVFHIDIPNGNNSAEVSWKTCAKDEQFDPDTGTVPSQVVDLPGKDNARWVKLQAGEYYEVYEMLSFSSGYLTNIQRRDEMDARAVIIRDNLLAEKQIDWDWYGFERTV